MRPAITTIFILIRKLANALYFSPIEPGSAWLKQKKWLTFFLMFLFWLCSPTVSHGQWATDIDSFVMALKPHFTPERIVDSLNEIAFLSAKKHEALSKKYADKAYSISMAQRNRYKKGIGEVYVRYGLLARNRGDYEEAEKYFLEALSIRKDIGEIMPIVNAYNNLGDLLRRQGKFSKALEYYGAGLKTAEGAKNEAVVDSGKAVVLTDISICHQHLGEYQKALEYNDEDIELQRKLGESQRAAYALFTSGTIYRKMKNFSSAEKSYEESLSIFKGLQDSTGMARTYFNQGNLHYENNEFREAFANYQKALNLGESLIDDELALVYRSIGDCYQEKEMENPDSALFFYNQSREIYESDENAWGLAEVEFSLGAFYGDRKQHQKALEHFMGSLNILEENQISDPSLEMNLFEHLADTYAELGDFEAAFRYRKWHSSFQDSLNTMAMSAANYKYSYEEQQRKIENLTHQTEIQRLEKMQLIISFIVIIVLLGSGAGIALLVNRQRQQKRKMEREKEQKDREIDDLLLGQEVKTTYARLEGQDEERRRIAQDLHDGLGGMLSTVKLYFSALDTKMDLIRMENREQYSKANQLLDEACEEVRRVSHEMHSGILKKFGLKAQLEDLAETINNSKQIKVELITHKLSGRLETQLEVNIYRIIQELIGNALKHAKASKLTIQLNRFDDIIHILVEDNGVGFKEGAALEKGGLGLSGVQARVKALDGKVDIDSALGRGTTISIDIPYQPREIFLENH